MHQKLLFAKYIAVKRLVKGYLTIALSVYTNTHDILSMESAKIPLYKGRGDQAILYISGIGLWLGKLHNSHPREIVEVIATYLSEICDGVFIIKQGSPGWIHLELTDSTIAAWLQNLLRVDYLGLGATSKELITSQNSSTVFSTQYTHARCCSLLRLAQQEGLIEFSHTVLSDFIPIQPISWFDREEKFLLNGLHEHHLINQLVKATDDYICPNDGKQTNWEQIARGLNQAFENFWQHCRIWGDVKTASPPLTQARIGLLIITQLVLKTLLTEKMRVFAPSEL